MYPTSPYTFFLKNIVKMSELFLSYYYRMSPYYSHWYKHGEFEHVLVGSNNHDKNVESGAKHQ